MGYWYIQPVSVVTWLQIRLPLTNWWPLQSHTLHGQRVEHHWGGGKI